MQSPHAKVCRHSFYPSPALALVCLVSLLLSILDGSFQGLDGGKPPLPQMLTSRWVVVGLHPEGWRPLVWGPPELLPEPPCGSRWWCSCSAGRGAAVASGSCVWAVTSVTTAPPAFLLRGCPTDPGHPGSPPSAHQQALWWVESDALLHVAWLFPPPPHLPPSPTGLLVCKAVEVAETLAPSGDVSPGPRAHWTCQGRTVLFS